MHHAPTLEQWDDFLSQDSWLGEKRPLCVESIQLGPGKYPVIRSSIQASWPKRTGALLDRLERLQCAACFHARSRIPGRNRTFVECLLHRPSHRRNMGVTKERQVIPGNRSN